MSYFTFANSNFPSGSENDTINMPSNRSNDRPVETEVNPNAPKDVVVPSGIKVPRGK